MLRLFGIPLSKIRDFTEFPQMPHKIWEFVKNAYRDDPRPVVKIAPDKYLADRTLEALLVSRYYQSLSLQAFYADLLRVSGEILELVGEQG